MVYMDADNNLEPWALEDFLEMAEIGSSDELSIVVQLDRSSAYDTRYGDWTTSKRFLIEHGMAPWPESALMDLGETNNGDPRTLIDFMVWAMNTFPSDHFALVLWDHGDGWRGPKTPSNPVRSIGYDSSHGGDTLTMDELDFALLTSQQVTGKFLDLIGFDACLMGMVEVATVVAPYAGYMVASQEAEPAEGWPYHLFLGDLATSPGSLTARELGGTIVSSFVGMYGKDPPVTLSCIDLGMFKELDLPGLVDSLARSLAPVIDQDCLRFSRSGSEVQSFYDPESVDLYDWALWASQVFPTPSVMNAASELMDALSSNNKACVAACQYSDDSLAGSHGLSIYFPRERMNLTYGDTAFAHLTYWDELIDTQCVFFPKGRVLLLDDDMGNFYEDYFVESLNALRIPFDIYDPMEYGPLESSILDLYRGRDKAVIWFTGDSFFNTLTEWDQQILMDFLAQGGRLFLTGQDIGFDIASTSFYTDVLQARYVLDNANLHRIEGKENDIIGHGLSFEIFGGDGANNQRYPSVIDSLGFSTLFLEYEGQQGGAGSYACYGAGRLAYLSFGFEGISSLENRTLLLSRIMKYLERAQEEEGWILVESDSPIQGWAHYGKIDSIDMAAVALEPSILSEIFMGHYVTDSHWWSAMALVNPAHATSCHAEIFLYDNQGVSLSHKVIPLEPRSKRTFLFREWVGETNGWIRVLSDVPVCAHMFYGSKRTGALAAVQSQIPSTSVSIPNATCGRDWYTGLVLTNPNPFSVQVCLDARSFSGQRIAGREGISMKPGSKIAGRIERILPDMGSSFTGWIHIQSDHPIIGLASNGHQQRNALACYELARMAPESTVVLGPLWSTNGQWTGLALASLNSVVLKWYSWTSLGEPGISDAPSYIPCMSSISGFSKDWFEDTIGNETISCASVTASEGIFLPLTVASKGAGHGLGQGLMGWIGDSSASSRLFLPHFRSSHDWFTQLYLIHPHDHEEAKVQIHLYGNDGKHLRSVPLILAPYHMFRSYVADLR